MEPRAVVPRVWGPVREDDPALVPSLVALPDVGQVDAPLAVATARGVLQQVDAALVPQPRRVFVVKPREDRPALQSTENRFSLPLCRARRRVSLPMCVFLRLWKIKGKEKKKKEEKKERWNPFESFSMSFSGSGKGKGKKKKKEEKKNGGTWNLSLFLSL